MKEKIKKYLRKKEVIIILILMIITISSLSYAFFVRTDETGSNIARTECFKLTLQGNNDINLQDAYPMSEQEGAALTPYTFTVRNICNTTADYQVNIETLNTSSLDTEYVRVKLDNNASMILKRNELNTTNVNQNVKEGRKIATGTLRSNEEITYNLRLWVDADSTKEQSANKTYTAKVSVMASPKEESHDVTIAYIVDGVQQDAPPAKGTGYKIKSVECTNGTGSWDNNRWGFNLDNIIGRVTCDLEFELSPDVTTTIYSAALDEVYYYNNNQKVVVGTTDATGKLENATIPSLKYIDLHSSIAKNPNNLSEFYSKSIMSEDNGSAIYLIPDNTVYWYGYKSNSNMTLTPHGGKYLSNTGDTKSATPTVTFNTNNINVKQISAATNGGYIYAGYASFVNVDISQYNKVKVMTGIVVNDDGLKHTRFGCKTALCLSTSNYEEFVAQNTEKIYTLNRTNEGGITISIYSYSDSIDEININAIWGE